MRSIQFDRLEFGYFTGRINRRDFIKDGVEQAKQAGKAEMKKADKSLREWGNSKERRGSTAF